MKNAYFRAISVVAGLQLLTGCGQSEPTTRSLQQSGGAESVASDGAGVDLSKSSDESVVESAVFSISRSESTGLTDGTTGWTVELEEKRDVTSNVPAQKYLKVSGTLKSASSEGATDIGCLQIELRDNVNYREQGWLRIATNGISGDLYSEVRAPIFINQNGWTALPILNDSLTLGKFAVNSVKKFDGSVCFKIDTNDLPSQNYKGQVVVQYLKSSVPRDEPAPILGVFACGQEPMAINAGAAVGVLFRAPSNMGELSYLIRSNPSMADAGSVSMDPEQADRLIYTAPKAPQQTFKAMIEARPSNSAYLPVFCEVHVISESDIGVGDDGEIQGVTGNVYKLAANTKKLPNFSSLKPLSQIVAANLDIPERAFSAGFPGVKDLFEWFGIQFKSTIMVPKDCSNCKFKLVSDDGAKLYLNDILVIDNDGLHSTAAKTGQKALSKGVHQIRVEYFQGPRYHITLQLMWDLDDGKGYQIIPATAFTRPLM